MFPGAYRRSGMDIRARFDLTVYIGISLGADIRIRFSATCRAHLAVRLHACLTAGTCGCLTCRPRSASIRLHSRTGLTSRMRLCLDRALFSRFYRPVRRIDGINLRLPAGIDRRLRSAFYRCGGSPHRMTDTGRAYTGASRQPGAAAEPDLSERMIGHHRGACDHNNCNSFHNACFYSYISWPAPLLPLFFRIFLLALFQSFIT